MRKLWHKLLDNLRITRILKNQEKIIGLQKENLFASRFNSSIQDSCWLRYRSFSPGSWAVDYSFLFVLYKILNGMLPSDIIEFGLGESSKMIHQYASYFKKKAVTIEHDEKWVMFFNKEKQGDYDIHIHLLDAMMTDYKGYQTRTYAGIDDYCSGKKYDLLVVDGPLGSDHYSRSQLIGLAKNNLSETFCIILDDTQRAGETETLNEVFACLDDMHVDYCTKTYSSIKSFTIICSQDLYFLTTLCS